MAKYDHEFLETYLRDICSLELFTNKLSDEIYYAQEELYELNQYDNIKKPERESYKSKGIDFQELGNNIGCVAFAIIALFVLCIFTKWLMHPWCLLIILSPIPITIIYKVRTAVNNRKEQEEALENRYQYRMNEYKKDLKRKKEAIPVKAELNQKIEQMYDELEKAEQLKEEVYNANIIPMQYRNIYSVMYLHNYVSSSGANDIDVILQTFILEEIKAKLDKIIEMQRESILNQEIMIALNRSSIQAQTEHNKIMEERARQISQTNDELNSNMRMIEANTSTLAYFATMDHWLQ